MEYERLDIENIARIGLMFLDGDDLEGVLLDKTGHTDYDFDKFNRLKACLMRIERIRPDMDTTGVLWQFYFGSDTVAIPVIAGSGLPVEGCKHQSALPELIEAFKTEKPVIKAREDQAPGCYSYYTAVYNSDDEPVGVLELLIGRGFKQDVSYVDMFVPPRVFKDDDDEE